MLKENVYGRKKRLDFISREIEIFSKISKRKPKILDVGCGSGELVTVPLGAKGCDIVGVDIDYDSIVHGKSRAGDVGFVLGEICSLPFKKKFDIIICAEVLEHTTEPNKVLSEMALHLANDGIMILTIPNGFGPFEMEKLILDKLGLRKLGRKILGHRATSDNVENMTKNMDCPHLHFFTRSSLKKTITTSGFKIIKTGKGAFMAGSLSAKILGLSPSFVELNVNVLPRYMPFFLVSNWYYVLSI